MGLEPVFFFFLVISSLIGVYEVLYGPLHTVRVDQGKHCRLERRVQYFSAKPALFLSCCIPTMLAEYV